MTYRLRLLITFSSVALVMLAVEPSPAAAQANQYIVSFVPGTPRAARAAMSARHGAALRFNYAIIDGAAVSVPNQNVLRALSQDPAVRSVVPDYPVFASQFSKAGKGKQGGGGTPPPAPAPQVLPLGVQRVGAATATSNGEGIGVAIVDTGIDGAHGDLASVAGSYDAFDGSTNCQDDNGHGTHVAGTVAALDNPIDVVGVAPAASLYCVKALDAQGSGSWSTIIAGLDWIWNNRQTTSPAIRVVNMSLGGTGTDTDSPFRQAIARLYNAGIVVVVAAGNDPSIDVKDQVPAAYSQSGYVLTVASTTAAAGSPNCGVTVQADTASYFTSDGTAVTISAPGEDEEDITRRGPNCYLNSVGILSLKLGGGTTRMSGTSMASPHVSGVVARLLQSPSTYGIPNPVGDGRDVDQVRIYFSSVSRGASLLGSAPWDSPAMGYSFDTVREGVAIVHATN
jgi:subtilisin